MRCFYTETKQILSQLRYKRMEALQAIENKTGRGANSIKKTVKIWKQFIDRKIFNFKNTVEKNNDLPYIGF